MLRSQILTIFLELNSQFGAGQYVEGAWLAMTEISEIILSTDECIYPDRTLHIYFDSAATNSKDLMKLGKGHYENDVFVLDKIESIVMYEQILGFLLSRATRMKSPYIVSATI
jgi:hypothetical protein